MTIQRYVPSWLKEKMSTPLPRATARGSCRRGFIKKTLNAIAEMMKKGLTCQNSKHRGLKIQFSAEAVQQHVKSNTGPRLQLSMRILPAEPVYGCSMYP
jgi:hypothetical protein